MTDESRHIQGVGRAAEKTAAMSSSATEAPEDIRRLRRGRITAVASNGACTVNVYADDGSVAMTIPGVRPWSDDCVYAGQKVMVAFESDNAPIVFASSSSATATVLPHDHQTVGSGGLIGVGLTGGG